MKKSTLFFACLSLLMLVGMLCSGLRAQETTEAAATYPVSLYGLTTTAEAPAHPESGWTEFVMPTLSGEERDTLNKTYLSTAAAPQNIETATEVTLQALGFDFKFGGRKMTHFGLTGNGLIYLSEADKRDLMYTSAFVSVPGGQSFTDVIAARIQATSEPQLVADAATKIGYYAGTMEATSYLMVGFRDMGLVFTSKSSVNYSLRLSYDVILYADGRVAFRFVDLNLTDAEKKIFFPVFGMRGTDGDVGIYADQWTGTYKNPTAAGNPLKSMTAMPTEAQKATVLTFTLPEPCQAPTGVAATFTVAQGKLYSTDFTGTLAKSGSSDGWLIFLADRETDVRPENGRVYEAQSGFATGGDSIAGFPVRYVANSSSQTLNIKGLKPSTTYYIYTYPYNDHCLNGPFYQADPVVKEVTTVVGGPAVETAAVGETAVTFNFPELAADTKVLVGMARRDYRKDASHYIIAGISGKAYETGDTLCHDAGTSNTFGNGPWTITVAHVGTVENGRLTIADLEPATPYYFYFWTALEGENQYSTEYVEHSIYTTATTPHTFTFETDRVPATSETLLPAGWRTSAEGMNIRTPFSAGKYMLKDEVSSGDENYDRRLGVNLAAASQAAGTTRADVITPAFRATQAALDVRYRARLQATGGNVSLLPLGEGDTLTVWYRVEGETDWRLISSVYGEEGFVYGKDHFASLKAAMTDVPQDRDIRLRFRIEAPYVGATSSGRTFVLHHVLVEPHQNCAYPENIEVLDALTTHRTVALGWKNANDPVVPVLYRYRTAGSENWSAWQTAPQPASCEIHRLKTHTAYEIALQAVCGAGDSSLVKMAKANTLRGLSYQQALTDLKAYPEDFGAWTGVLPEEETEAVTLKSNSNYFGHAVGTLDGHTYAGTPCNVSATSKAWLTLPVLCLENTPAPAEYTFQYMAFSNKGGEVNAVSPESPFNLMVLVSQDGQFHRADSVGEITVKDLADTHFQTYTIDLSNYTDKVYVALYVKEGDTKSPDKNYYYFLIDSIAARYTGNRPCDAVENIHRSGLTATGVTLSWEGYSLEYGIYYTDEDAHKTDTAYTTDLTYTLADLRPGTLYTYRIQGFCDEGHQSPGALSEEGYFTTRDLCRAPSMTVVGTTWRSVTVVAKSSSDKLLHIWAKDESLSDLDYSRAWAAEQDTLTYGGLSEKVHVTYYAAVRNVCGVGDSSDWTEPVEFTTDMPECGDPTDLTCHEVGVDYAELSWKAGKNNDAFKLMYRAAEEARFDTIDLTETAYRLTDLQAKTAYVWQLQAVYDEVWFSAAVKSDFVTKAEPIGDTTAVEPADPFESLKVGVQNGRIAVWNAGALPIDRVEVYALTGRRLYGADFGAATDHLWLPVLAGDARLVLVRIFSKGETAVYKVVL